MKMSTPLPNTSTNTHTFMKSPTKPEYPGLSESAPLRKQSLSTGSSSSSSSSSYLLQSTPSLSLTSRHTDTHHPLTYSSLVEYIQGLRQKQQTISQNFRHKMHVLNGHLAELQYWNYMLKSTYAQTRQQLEQTQNQLQFNRNTHTNIYIKGKGERMGMSQRLRLRKARSIEGF